MGISNFGGNSPKDKVIQGQITYLNEESNVGHCGSCCHSTIYPYSFFKDKLVQDQINSLDTDEVYCTELNKKVRKWYDCCYYCKKKQLLKGWFYNEWFKSDGYSISAFKDIVTDKNSIIQSVGIFDKNNEECFLFDIVCNERSEAGIVVHDRKTNRILIINLLCFKIFQKELTKTNNILLFEIGKKGFEIVSSIYELNNILKMSIEDFVKELKIGKKIKKKK